MSDTLDKSGLSKGQMMPEKRRFPAVLEPRAYSIYPESGQGANLRATEVEVSPVIAAVDGSKQSERGLRLASAAGVCRLTPLECERLQGLPDGWTLPGSDSKRYAALGDAVTANVAEWIGRRILHHEQKEVA